jgi:hypothetical protein
MSSWRAKMLRRPQALQAGRSSILNFTAALSQMVLAGNHCRLGGLGFRELERLRT